MVNFITTNPYVEAVAKAQDAVDRRDEIAFKREQQANQRDEWDRARVTNLALGEAA